MPPTNDISPTLDFLNDAAHLLAKAAPETSAYLLSSRNELMFSYEIPQSDLEKQHICGSCGHILIIGQGSTMRIEAKKMTRKKRTRSSSQQRSEDTKELETRTAASKVFTCGNCGRFTGIRAPPPTPVFRKKVKHTAVELPATTQNAASQKPQGANASSKKRAKSRKAGLQALLAQSNANKNSSLSLADFMKK